MQTNTKTQKLKLSKDTLRRITSEQLDGVAGGILSNRHTDCRTCATAVSCTPVC